MEHFSSGANVSEREFLPPPVAVSTVIFASENSQIWVPLILRQREPFKGQWALPGGLVTWEESLTDVALRTLRETAGIAPQYLEQLYTFGELDRGLAKISSTGQGISPSNIPAQRIISIVYWALIDAETRNRQDQIENVSWFPADDLPLLAFDHNRIANYALWRLRNKVEYSTVAGHLLGSSFTLRQLRQVYQAILGRSLDAGNFRRQIIASGELEETGEYQAEGAHRPAKLYRYAKGQQIV